MAGVCDRKWDSSEEFPEHTIPSEERDLAQIALEAQTLLLPLIERYQSEIIHVIVCNGTRHAQVS